MEMQPHEPQESEVSAASAGELLRRAREAGGHSLDQVAEATKISKTYLRALEENRFQDLPSPAYLKGFLKIYADYLGLSVDQLTALLTGDRGVPAETTAETAPQEALPRQRFRGVQRYALPLTLLAVVLVSTLFFQPASQHAPLKPEAPLPQKPVVQQAVQAAVSSRPAPLPAAPAAEQPQPPAPEEGVAPSPPPQNGFVVRMKVLKNGTLTVTIDETVSQNYQLNSGDLIEWKAVSNLALDLSDAGGVELELNGKPLKYQATAGRSAHLVLGPGGVQQ